MRIVGLMLLLVGGLWADELDFASHHPSGAALVTHASDQFAAAYQMDDFDVAHQPLQLKLMFRLMLVPQQPFLFETTDRRERWRLSPKGDGHVVLEFEDWTVELIPVDPNERLATARLAGIGVNAAWALSRVRVERRRDAILITVVEGE